MADVELNDVLRIGAIMRLQTLFEIANVWHVRVTSGAPLGFAAASQDIAEYMDEIYDNIVSQMTDAQLPVAITLQNVTQATTFGAFAWDVFAGGTNTNAMTAPGVSLLAWARTLTPRVQIRKYFGVFTELDMDVGQWTAGARTACIGALTDHITPFTGTNGLQMLGVAYNRTLLTTTDGLSVTTSSEPAYQRRRKRGRGS